MFASAIEFASVPRAGLLLSVAITVLGCEALTGLDRLEIECVGCATAGDADAADANADAAPSDVGDDATPIEPPAKVVVVGREGDGAGSVESTPSGIACGATCSFEFLTAADVTLTATPEAGSLFVGWGGACSGPARTCTVNLNGAKGKRVVATFVKNPYNVVFVTRAKFTGALGGLSGADAECAKAATAASLTGEYRAWLSTSSVTARSRFATARGFVRVDGKPFADRVDDLVAGVVLNAVALDQFGMPFADSAYAWTGTDASGGASPEGTCSDWTSASSTAKSQKGLISGGPRWWTAKKAGSETCNGAYPLYCFGSDKNATLVVNKTAGRVAFLSATASAAPTDVASIDARCAAQASAAGLSGTFKALLARGEASAISRFNTAGPPWVRRDGQVVATGEDLLAGRVQSGIWQNAAGSYLDESSAWTGATTVNAPPTENCADWTNFSSGAQGTTGAPYASDGQWFSRDLYRCDAVTAFYCLQE